MRILLPAALVLLAAASAAQAQTYVPGQAQANINQYQLQMQANQLQQMQRQNSLGYLGGNPGARAQVQQRQVDIQRQVDQNRALQQQAGQADPSSLNAQLQASGARIQQLRRQPPLMPQP